MGAREAAVAPRRERLRVRGVVQGVGFRPFVWRLAHELAIRGSVLNDADGVLIDAAGADEALEALVRRLRDEAPPLARIDAIERTACSEAPDTDGFRIATSRAGEAHTVVPADAAPCVDCRRELFTAGDRREGYAFLNCTHCGPRYSIAHGVPFDRPRTSMAGYAMCPACAREYGDPADRRFHAQANACPVCGPRLALFDAEGGEIEGDPVAEAQRILAAGGIVAVKSVGGFQLACDARNAAAVAALRARKSREAKPFAVMAATVETFAPYASITAAEATLLASPERPIVLVAKKDGCDAALAGVAPGMGVLGAMLPASPLHELLLADPHPRPPSQGRGEKLYVMTSANPGGEPLVTGVAEAFARLGGIADAFLVHDREIVARSDDSVTQVGVSGPGVLRRARGYVPRGIPLGRDGLSVLACGAGMKTTVCATRGSEAFLSPHIGDLDNAATCTAFEEAVARLLDMLQVAPARVAHDLHPDFHGSAFAAAWSERHGIPAIAVQHHHAHIAAVCAERRHDGPVLGLALDGIGLGSDGQAWGGELLMVDGARFSRLGHLAPLAMPGGDRAAEEPWRMGAAVLDALGRTQEIAGRFHENAAPALQRWLQGAVRLPRTTSAGRWFDAAAALLGVRTVSAFEGQAAMELEALATRHGPTRPMDGGCVLGDDGVLDLLPLAAALADERDAARGAALFHDTLGEGLARWVLAAAARHGLRTVALAGGCFANRRLAARLVPALRAARLEVLEAHLAPCNDGGIALGQAWVALHAES